MKKRIICRFIAIIALCGVFFGCFFGCEDTENLSMSFNNSAPSLYINSTINLGVRMSNGSYPLDKVSFEVENSDIIEIETWLSNYMVRLKGVAVGSTKITAQYQEHEVQIDIIVKGFYNSVGDGTLNSPFELSEFEHLEQLFASEHENEHFILMNDITIENAWYAPSLTGQAYLGHSFKGHFNGNGKTIEFLQGRGFLFGDNYGTITNLRVKGQGEGAFIADLNAGEISNCIVEGTINILDMFNQFGSIANYNTGSIKNCVSSADIIANEHTYAIGGICGVIESGIIENCLFLGSITINSAYNNGDSVGAILGQRYSENAILKNLYYDENIISQSNVKAGYFYPVRAVGFHGIGIPLSETENVINVLKVNDWQSISFDDFSLEIWDFSEIIPRLAVFLQAH